MYVLTGASNVRLDGNDANSFLVQKRDFYCRYVQNQAEMFREGKVGSNFGPTVDVYEECCDEGCDSEEMNENMHPHGHSDTDAVRTVNHARGVVLPKILDRDVPSRFLSPEAMLGKGSENFYPF